MPVANLEHLPRTDCFKAEIGGSPKMSHASDFDLFGVTLSFNKVNIGISPAMYRHLVADLIEQHRGELDAHACIDADPYWDFLCKELMVNNIATYYLAKIIVCSLRRIAKASLAQLRPAQTTPSIFNNNHMVIVGELRCAHSTRTRDAGNSVSVIQQIQSGVDLRF